MPRYRSKDHPLTQSTSWIPAKGAEWINDHILMSRSNSNSYLITTDDGDVVVNTDTRCRRTGSGKTAARPCASVMIKVSRCARITPRLLLGPECFTKS